MYDHCISAEDCTYELGKKCLDEPYKAQIVGYLHDISAATLVT